MSSRPGGFLSYVLRQHGVSYRSRLFIRPTYGLAPSREDGNCVLKRGVSGTSGHAGDHDILDILEQRGLINQIAGDRAKLKELLAKHEKPGVYCGVDATAKSMHVGHLVPFMALFWMCLYGHASIALVGGATAKIGDPTGRLTSREALSASTGAENVAGITAQFRRMWDNVKELAPKHGLQIHNMREVILDNDGWASNVKFLEILQRLGTGFRLGAMLARDTVKNKIENGDGMSYAEFSYPLLQAWDWWHLYGSDHRVLLQIGGSDQYGNITAGIDAINHMKSHTARDTGDVYGFTVPLLTTAAGEKFGKSAGNAVWLNADLTSVFDLYQFLVSTPDADVERLLRFFTFLPLLEISELLEEHTKDQSQRKAQHKLASEFVALVHGREQAQDAYERHKALFAQRDTPAGVFESAPRFRLRPDEVWGHQLPHVLHEAGLSGSKSEANRLILGGAVYIGTAERGELRWKQVRPDKTSLSMSVDKSFRTELPEHSGIDWILFRVGKKTVRSLCVSDSPN